MCVQYPDESFKVLFDEAGIQYQTMDIPELFITLKK